MTDPRPDGRHLPLLDWLRFGAALLVLFGHARGLIFVGIGQVEQPGAATKLFYLLTGLQHEGVVLFFVISGYLVGGLAWRAMAAGRFDGQRYLIARFSRIYIVLVPALVFVFLLDRVGHSLFGATRFYAERPLFPSGITDGWTWPQALCHAAALPGVQCPAWGANPVLWSLGWEWFFYLATPALFAIVVARLPASSRLVFLLCWAAAVTTVTGFGDGLLWLAIWLVGAGAARLTRMPVALAWAGGILALGAMVVSRTGLLPIALTDIAIGGGMALVLANRTLIGLPLAPRWGEFGASFSYSLYLIHLPVALFAAGALQRLGWPAPLVAPSGAAYAAFAGLVAVGIGASIVFAALTERHTDALRARLGGTRGSGPA